MCRKLFFVIIFVLAAGLFLPATTQAEELLLNTGFESGNWQSEDSLPDNWWKWSDNWGWAGWRNNAEQAHNGSKFIYVGGGGSGEYAYFGQTINVSPGVAYIYSSWAKTEDWGSPTGSLRVEFKDSGNNTLRIDTLELFDGSRNLTWTQYTLTTDPAPAGSVSANFLCYGGSSGTAWFDDVSVMINDVTPPEPNPMTWGTKPNATGTTTISMTATTASDDSGVEYYFECITDNNHNSGWQDSTIYVDTGLNEQTQYAYRVKARDKSVNHNETAWSSSASDTTPVPGISHVDANATGANNGFSWANAYTSLQDALAAASDGNNIWVAQGAYKPDQGSGITPGDRTATFQLKNGVVVEGGYAGYGESDSYARDIDLYKTILSGDLNGNDDEFGNPELRNNGENSYHVVTGSATDETAVLDGFIITAGSANGESWNDNGAGMFNYSGNPMITNCTFYNNWAGHYIYYGNGAGMYNSVSSPTLTNCTFSSENRSLNKGGGMYNGYGSNPVITNCTFSGNTTAGGGGGIYNDASSAPILTDCTFSENHGHHGGGGMYNASSNPTLTNCTFSGAHCYGEGGGIHNRDSSPVLVNCTFSDNDTYKGGAGMYNCSDSSPILTNCTFSRNVVTYFNSGAGIRNQGSSKPILTNCILWGNSDSGGMDESAQICGNPPVVNYCCIQGWTGSFGGTGNIGDDPLFVDADGNDYRLQNGSPCIDAGDSSAIPLGIIDLDCNPRITNGIVGVVDMGVYESDYSLLAHYKLDEASGSDAADSSGNSNTGTLYGNPTWQPTGGEIGGALDFDGNGDYVQTDNDANKLQIENDYTLALWVNAHSSQTGWAGILAKTDPEGNGNHWALQFDDSGDKIIIYHPTGEPCDTGITLGDIDDGWHHISIVRNGYRSTMISYLDGKEKNRSNWDQNPGNGNGHLNIGTDRSAWSFFEGQLDDIRIYNRVLSEAEIMQLACGSNLPGQASNPEPPDTETNISRTAKLSWTTGSGTTSRKVYFGTDATPDESEFQSDWAGTTFGPGTMDANTTYYWRIDEENANGTTSGEVWSFTTGATTASEGGWVLLSDSFDSLSGDWQPIYLAGDSGGSSTVSDGQLVVGVTASNKVYGVYNDNPVSGHFYAEVEFEDDDDCGLVLIQEKNGEPDPNNFTSICVDENAQGYVVVKVSDRQKGADDVRDYTGSLPDSRYETILDGSVYSVPFVGTNKKIRIFYDDRAGFFHFYYAVEKEIKGVSSDGWMELAPSKDWAAPGQKYYVALVARSGASSAEVKFDNLKVMQKPREDRDDTQTGFAVTQREYNWSGFSADGDAVVITFGDEFDYRDSDRKFVFWSENNYVPAWHLNNQLLYSYEFLETWPVDGGDYRCFEPVSDRLLRWSDVEVLEDNDVRKVVHWHYVLCDPNYKVPDDDPCGPNELPEGDEYWTFYPDGTGVRHIVYTPRLLDNGHRSWHEISELMAIAGSLTNPGEHLASPALSVLNLDGDIETYYPGDDWADTDTDNWNQVIMATHFKNAPDAFNVFSDGSDILETYSHYPVACYISWHGTEFDMCHWPVGLEPYQLPDRTDGTWKAQVSHTSLINAATVDEGINWADYYKVDERDREYREWISLVGLNERNDSNGLRDRTDTWLYPGDVNVLDPNNSRFERINYNQRELVFDNIGDEHLCYFTLEPNSVVVNPVFKVRNWGSNPAKVNIDGQWLTKGRDFKAATLAPATQLLLNTGFESGNWQNEDSVPDNWWKWSDNWGWGGWRNNADQAHSGSKFIYAGGEGSGEYAYFGQTIDVSPGDAYVYSTWAKTEDWGSPTGSLRVEFKDSGNNTLRMDTLELFNGSQSDTWTQYTLITDPAPAGSVSANFLCYGGSSGTAWFDDVSVKRDVSSVIIWVKGRFDSATTFAIQDSNDELPSPNSSDDGLLAYYKFDGASFSTVIDSSGNGNTGVLQNGPNRVPDVNTFSDGNAIEFDGDNDFVQTSDSSSKLQLTGDYTLAAWVNADSTQDEWAAIFMKTDPDAADNHWGIQFDDSGERKLRVYHPNGWWWDTGIKLSDVNDGWYHISVVRSGNTMTSYRNGSKVVDGDEWNGPNPGNGSGHLKIGADRGLGHFFTGQLDNIRVYNCALGAGEISAIYNEEQ